MRRLICAAIGAVTLGVGPAGATMLEKLGLDDLVTRSDRVFRGTVIDVEQSTIEAGGGTLPVVVYTLRVEDMLKGAPDVIKGDVGVITVRMVGSIKEPAADDTIVRLPIFRDVPKLASGHDYVLFMTPESPIGLSVTVGLGQGAFDIVRPDKTDLAVNAFGNAGLGLGDGPVAYDALKAAVAREAGSQE